MISVPSTPSPASLLALSSFPCSATWPTYRSFEKLNPFQSHECLVMRARMLCFFPGSESWGRRNGGRGPCLHCLQVAIVNLPPSWLSVFFMTFYVQRRDSIYAFLLLLGNHLLLHAYHLGVGQVGIYSYWWKHGFAISDRQRVWKSITRWFQHLRRAGDNYYWAVRRISLNTGETQVFPYKDHFIWHLSFQIIYSCIPSYNQWFKFSKR